MIYRIHSGVQKSIIATEVVDKFRASIWIRDIDMSVVDIDYHCIGVANVDIDCQCTVCKEGRSGTIDQ